MIWIETISGMKVDLEHPKAEMIRASDIAIALSNICRFSGHVNQFYSVAQHCVMCANQLPYELKLAGLLHDAHEAYTSDIPSPVKQLIDGGLPWLEFCLQAAIDDRFNSHPTADQLEVIKEVDERMLITEAIALRGKRFDGYFLDVEPYDIEINPLLPSAIEYIWMSNLTRFLRNVPQS